MKSYKSTVDGNVVCPFYMGLCDKRTIRCEGVERYSTFNIAFNVPSRLNKYMSDFCNTHCYRGCVLYQLIDASK